MCGTHSGSQQPRLEHEDQDGTLGSRIPIREQQAGRGTLPSSPLACPTLLGAWPSLASQAISPCPWISSLPVAIDAHTSGVGGCLRQMAVAVDGFYDK